jgi:hypothetical protein
VLDLHGERDRDIERTGRESDWVREWEREEEGQGARPPFSRTWGARWRAVETRRAHAALGHTTRRPTPKTGRPLLLPLPIQTDELLILPQKYAWNVIIPPLISLNPFSFCTSWNNQSCRATRDLQLCLQDQSLIRLGSRDTKLQTRVCETLKTEFSFKPTETAIFFHLHLPNRARKS